MRPTIRRSLFALGLVLAASACTPEQMAAWLEQHELPVPEDQAELAAQAEMAETFWQTFIEQLIAQAQAAPAPTPEPVPAAAPAGGISWPWSALVECEASGNWFINTGNGYYGGLQFAHSTWVAYGGQAYAAYAHQASPEAQITVAQQVVAAAGGSYSAWPACRARLGLP